MHIDVNRERVKSRVYYTLADLVRLVKEDVSRGHLIDVPPHAEGKIIRGPFGINAGLEVTWQE